MKLILTILAILYLTISSMDYNDQLIMSHDLDVVDFTDTGVGCVYDCLDPASDVEVARLNDNIHLSIKEGE